MRRGLCLSKQPTGVGADPDESRGRKELVRREVLNQGSGSQGDEHSGAVLLK